MKKTIALLMALLLVVSFTACGSSKPATETDPKPLPVKFGAVTDIEIVANNSEAIILSMEEPSSSKGAERDVYIAAVDYIFTHASQDLEELYVTAHAPNGDNIISFTMPSYLITALRDVEAQGDWGTEGFCAFFYFNYEAYDVLVASCIVAENP